jgi:hypothetical protein
VPQDKTWLAAMNFMRLLTTVVFTTLLLAMGKSLAQTYIGGGIESCGSWSHERMRDSHKAAALLQWSLGYVSGRNVERAEFLKGVDGPAILAWLDGYCQQHPLDKLENANEALVSELRLRARAKRN